MVINWFSDGIRIAKIEWRRHHRELGYSQNRQIIMLLILCAVSISLGSASWVVGQELTTETPELFSLTSLATTITFVWLVIQSSSLTNRRFEQLAPDALLTAVPIRTATLGIILFVLARVGAILVIPTLSIAVGLALGVGSPVIAISVITAIAALAVLAVAVGTAGRLASILIGRSLARGSLYRAVLILFSWVPLVALYFLLQEFSVSVVQLASWFEWVPLALLADLAFLGAGEQVGVSPLRGFAAIIAVALVSPLLFGLTAVFTRRLWISDPIGSSRQKNPSESHSATSGGWVGRLMEGYVSQPVITIARDRLLSERRVPRGLLNTAYVVLVVGVIGLPLFALFAVPGFLLLVLALGTAVGLAFGSDPIGKSYRVLPMLLTTIQGREFIGGFVLAGLIVGAPLITLIVVPLGVVSDASFAETIALTITGIALCACAATVNVAIEMDADRADLVLIPGFFTDVPLYGKEGWSAFSGMARTFAVASIVILPAFFGNSQLVYGQLASLGFPTTVVRIGGLCITVLLAVGVSKLAFGIAVDRYRDYELD